LGKWGVAMGECAVATWPVPKLLWAFYLCNIQYIYSTLLLYHIAFSALLLSVGYQEEHPTFKN